MKKKKKSLLRKEMQSLIDDDLKIQMTCDQKNISSLKGIIIESSLVSYYDFEALFLTWISRKVSRSLPDLYVDLSNG